jgi:hypothetical protein
MNNSMDTHTQWTGARHKTHEPIRGRERARPTVFTFRAPRFNVPRSNDSGHASRITHQPIVTSKFDIFFTISIPNFKNTLHRPLPLNHLRKMPKKTVKFLVDFAPYVSRFTFHVLRVFRNVTSQLHRSCTVSSPIFDFHFHYPLPINHLQNRHPKMVQFLGDIPSHLIHSGLHRFPLPTSTSVPRWGILTCV